LLGARAGKHIAQGLLMDIPDREVPAAIDNAAHHVAVRMDTHEFEGVSAAKAPEFAHFVCLGNASALSCGVKTPRLSPDC